MKRPRFNTLIEYQKEADEDDFNLNALEDTLLLTDNPTVEYDFINKILSIVGLGVNISLKNVASFRITIRNEEENE